MSSRWFVACCALVPLGVGRMGGLGENTLCALFRLDAFGCAARQ